MTPNPAPRPVATLGCFALCAFGLISVVVLGASLNTAALVAILTLVFVVLILTLARILSRRRPPPGSSE